jgi:hypothetical protein
LIFEAIVCKSALVVQPLLVDIVVHSGLDAVNLCSSRVDSNVAADTVEDIDTFRLLEFPRSGLEGVWLARKSSDRAEIDDVSRHFRIDDLLNVCSNLHLVSSAGASQLVDAGDFVCEANAPRAVDASRHNGLDERSHVLVFYGSLAGNLVESCSVASVTHRLVLQIALSWEAGKHANNGHNNERQYSPPSNRQKGRWTWQAI